MEWRAPRAEELVAAMVDAIVMVDRAASRVRYWSAGAERLFGWTAEEAAGVSIHELLGVPPLTAEAIESFVRTLRVEGRVTTTAERGRKDGTRLWVESRYTLVHDPDGTEVGILGVIRDVTATKKASDERERMLAELAALSAKERAAREELARHEELLRSIFRAMEEAVVVYDATGGVIETNPAAESILGVAPSTLRGATAASTPFTVVREDGTPCPPHDRPAWIALREAREVRGTVLGVKRSDGTLRWVAVSATPLRANATDAPYAAVATMTDITEARRSAALLHEREATLRRVLSGSNDGFFELDLTTGAAVRSPRVAEMLGVDPERIPASLEGWLVFVHPEDAPAVRTAIGRVASGEADAMDLEYRARADANDDWRWLHARARRSDTSRGVALAGTISDVTERRRAQQALDAELRINARLVDELREALSQVSTLSGFIPICMHCHKIRDDKGFWERLERYIATRTGAQFSHGLCPECEKTHYPKT